MAWHRAGGRIGKPSDDVLTGQRALERFALFQVRDDFLQRDDGQSILLIIELPQTHGLIELAEIFYADQNTAILFITHRVRDEHRQGQPQHCQPQ